MRSTPPLGPRSGILQVFRGQEASFMRKIGTSFRKPSATEPGYYCLMIVSSVYNKMYALPVYVPSLCRPLRV